MRKSKIRNHYLPSCILTNFHNILTFNASNINPACLPKLRVHLPCVIDVKFSSAILKKYSHNTHIGNRPALSRGNVKYGAFIVIYSIHFSRGLTQYLISVKNYPAREHTLSVCITRILQREILLNLYIFGCFSPLFFCFVTLKVDAVQF